MPDRSKLHVVPHDDDWAVKREGGARAVKVLPTKEKAVDEARRIAKNEQPSQVIIHKQDGTIQEERTYKNDPFPPKG